MGTRINLQYSIDIDDLESEVTRLLHSAFSQLEGVVNPTPSNVLSLECVGQIETLRQDLMKVDHSLRDVNNIINSYVQYRMTEQMERDLSDMAPAPLPEEVENYESPPEE